MNMLVAFICGILMSLGLVFSGMVNPRKVIGFLDVFGNFDPTLGFVMAGALAVASVGFRLVGRSSPLLGGNFELPKKSEIDLRLLAGAALFGVGWGLAGFCPGPALVSVGLGLPQAGVFVPAMLLGMFLARKILK